MFAIVEAFGRQFQLEAGRFVDVDLTDGAEGDQFVFDRVLMLVDGEKSTLGAPFIDGAKVEGRILKHGKAKKIIVYHMRPKKGTRKKQGHRQHYTRVLIDTIKLNNEVLSKSEEKAPRAKKAEPAAKESSEKKEAPARKAAPAKKAEPAKEAEGAKKAEKK